MKANYSYVLRADAIIYFTYLNDKAFFIYDLKAPSLIAEVNNIHKIYDNNRHLLPGTIKENNYLLSYKYDNDQNVVVSWKVYDESK